MKDVLKTAAILFFMLTIIPLSAFLFKGNTETRFVIFDEATEKSNTLSAQEYVIGALCCEMPPTFHAQALRAQAAAIYTNALRNIYAEEEYVARVNTEKRQGYVPKEILKEQWGKSFSVYYDKMSKAVNDVLGCVITYESKPILAAYHSMSSGKTESAENVWGQAVAYLVSVPSEGDTFSAELSEQKSFPINEVRKILSEGFPQAYLPEVDTLLLTEPQYSPSGTLISVMVGNVKTTGQKLRSLFSLRSAAITFEIKEGTLSITTKGYGHSVGMSQYGADFMARQGSDWKEILKHYYKGTSVMYSEQE